MIELKVIKLTRAKNSRDKNKRLNILNIYNNVKSSILEGVYFHYFDKPVTAEESIAHMVKLRRQRLDIIDKNKENINNELFNHYFSYLNPNIMIKRLKNASDEKNKDIVESTNKKLNKIKYIVKNVPRDEVSRVEENEGFLSLIAKNNLDKA